MRIRTFESIYMCKEATVQNHMLILCTIDNARITVYNIEDKVYDLYDKLLRDGYLDIYKFNYNVVV